MIKIFFDGSCEPVNPGGTAAWGFVIKDGNGRTLRAASGVVGSGRGMTNNVAEYRGLIAALRELESFNEKEFVQIYGDSKLVICHLNREWGWEKSRSGKTVLGWNPHRSAPHLRMLLDEAMSLLDKRPTGFSASWIPREENWECDALSKAHVASRGAPGEAKAA